MRCIASFRLSDLNGREIAIMIPLLVMIFFMGLYPKPFIDKMDPAIRKLVSQVRVASVNAQVIPVSNQILVPVENSAPSAPPVVLPPPSEGAAATHAEPTVNPHESKK